MAPVTKLDENDNLRLQLATSRQETAEHRFAAAQGQVELAAAALRDAMAVRNATISGILVKYQIDQADTIAADGTIQRAGKVLPFTEAPAS
jgi:hypothetical protein